MQVPTLGYSTCMNTMYCEKVLNAKLDVCFCISLALTILCGFFLLFGNLC